MRGCILFYSKSFSQELFYSPDQREYMRGRGREKERERGRTCTDFRAERGREGERGGSSGSTRTEAAIRVINLSMREFVYTAHALTETDDGRRAGAGQAKKG